jgi:hypothetical protein
MELERSLEVEGRGKIEVGDIWKDVPVIFSVLGRVECGSMDRRKLESDIGLGGRVFELGYVLANQDFAWYHMRSQEGI